MGTRLVLAETSASIEPYPGVGSLCKKDTECSTHNYLKRFCYN